MKGESPPWCREKQKNTVKIVFHDLLPACISAKALKFPKLLVSLRRDP